MDSIDWELIELMAFDSQQSFRELANKVFVSPSTTRRRIRRLSELGIVRFKPVIDYERIGLKVSALFGLDVAHSKLQEILDYLESIPEIHWTSTTTGRFNIIAFGRFPSNEILDIFLRTKFLAIEGVNHCETFLCLHIRPLSLSHLSSLKQVEGIEDAGNTVQ